MRKLLILSAMLLSLAGSVHSQEAGLPPCSAEQLAATDSYMTDHFDLMGAAMTPEMVAALSSEVYEDLGELITNETSSETLRDYGETLFAWRESFWEAHPICDEVFDIGLAMGESASDMATFLAYQLAGISPENNPYVGSLRESIGYLGWLLDELPDGPAGEVDPALADLPACTDEDLGILSQELAVYRALLEVPPRTYSIVGLAKYGVAQLAWRDTLWSRLPPCDLSLQVGLLMSHITSDLAVELAFEIAEMPAEAAPFSERIASDQARLEELSAPIEAAENSQAYAESFLATLPECGDDEMLAFSARNSGFPGLVDSLKAAETVPDLLAAAEEHLVWRATLEANPPDCIESMMTAGLMLRVAGNYVASLALDIAGIMPEPSAEMPIKPHLFGIVTIGAIADDISETMRASGLQPDELMEMAAASSGLPDCGEGDIGLNFYNLFLEYSDLVDYADSLETVGDVMAFRQAQIDWAENNIEGLPGCTQAIEAGFMMYTILADYSAAYALLIAGAAVEDIPYAKTIGIYRDRLDAWLKRELQ
ncbi:MAG: hypothetical protein OXG78_08690 [Chloroflexi bacterium]|nr:hypothetical protein [Chloroflexota bacterium]